MKITISGKNLEITEALRNAVLEKLGRLEKYFASDVPVLVTMSVQKDTQKIEVTIPVRGNIIRSEQESSDMYVSIDLAAEVIERQLVRYKSRLVAQKQNLSSFSDAFLDEEEDGEEGICIEKIKKFSLKPMDPEEACLQMEMLGHNFFVFVNADTGETSVVYKRKNGTYGLIEPDR